LRHGLFVRRAYERVYEYARFTQFAALNQAVNSDTRFNLVEVGIFALEKLDEMTESMSMADPAKQIEMTKSTFAVPRHRHYRGAPSAFGQIGSALLQDYLKSARQLEH